MDWKTYLQTTFLHEYFVDRADELETIYAGEVSKEVSHAMFEVLVALRYYQKTKNEINFDERYEKFAKKEGVSKEVWEMVKHSLEDMPKEKIENLYSFFADVWMITEITNDIMEQEQCSWEKAIEITNDFTVISLLADREDMRSFVYHYSPTYWAEKALQFQKQLQSLKEEN